MTSSTRAALRSPRVFVPPEPPPPLEALCLLERLSRRRWLALPPVGLPDLHCKPRLEAPSSLAAATRDVWVMGLTSPSPHCGMALGLTDLASDDLTPERLDRFFDYVASRLGPGRTTPVLDDAAFDAVLLGGLAAWKRRDERVVVTDSIASHGMAFHPDEATASAQAILATIPPWLRPIGRAEFGLVGGGDHFLELQVVQEVLDRRIAASWGILEGQVVVMVHADSGHLGAILGRFLAHRRKNPQKGRWQEWRAKLPYHLRHASGPAALLERIPLFWPARWVPVRSGSEAGRLCRWAMGAAANYAAAGRLAIYGTVAGALAAAGWPGAVRLLWDAPHNGIWRETHAGQEVWVHRHNAARVAEGQPVLLPANERICSLLCVGGTGTGQTLGSVCHGLGRIALHHGRPDGEESQQTRLYGYGGGAPRPVPHLSDDGVAIAMRTLADHDIAYPVARLHPVATLKGDPHRV